MIPWASFTQQRPNYTDRTFSVSESRLRHNVGPDLDLSRDFEESCMLKNASERRFALSQLPSSSYNLGSEHPEDISSTLKQLSDYFDKNALFMPSPTMPNSPYKDYLQGLTSLPVPTLDIPDFQLNTPTTTIPSPSPSPPPSRRLPSPTRLSISSLVHHDPAPNTTPSAPQALPSTTIYPSSSPMIADSDESPIALDASIATEDTPFALRPYASIFNMLDDEVKATVNHYLRPHDRFSNPHALSIPSNNTRMRRSPRVRRPSRSRSQIQVDQQEEFKREMERKAAEREREIERIDEEWRTMKRKEEAERERERERVKCEEDAILLLNMHESGQSEEEEDGPQRGGKRIKLENDHKSRVEDTGERDRVGRERYGKYDRGPP